MKREEGKEQKRGGTGGETDKVGRGAASVNLRGERTVGYVGDQENERPGTRKRTKHKTVFVVVEHQQL